MTERIALYRRNLLLLAAGWMAIAAPGVIAAQTQTATPSFEVATIKPSNFKAPGSNLGFNRNNHFVTNNMDLKSIIKFAYNLNSGSDDQIARGPGWIGTAKFDIDAKEDDVTSTMLGKMPIEQRLVISRSIVRLLLEDRFKLQVHHETRELSINALVVAKGGSKLKPSPNAPTGWSGLHNDGQGHIEGRGATLDMLASMLGNQSEVGGRMVIDKTGLAGKYDFVLKWTPDGVATEDPGPSLFTALQEQLGLKVESTKAPTDVLVIDHVETPSEN